MSKPLKIDLTINLSDSCSVHAEEVLPGLAVHKAVNGSKLHIITHILSGTAVTPEFHRDYQGVIVQKLSAVSWLGVPESWVSLPSHRAVWNDIVRYLSNMEKGPARSSADNRLRSVAQETRLAADIGGKRVPGSGAVPGFPRDVINTDVMIEAKTSTAESFRVDMQDVALLMRQAMRAGKLGAYVVQVLHHEEVVLLRPDDAAESLGALREELVTVGKTFNVTVNMAKNTYLEDFYRRVQSPYGTFVVVGYERFLSIVRGRADVRKRATGQGDTKSDESSADEEDA